VPAGKTFTLDGTTYTSSATDPVTGTGAVTMNKTAPKLTVGWGNLVPRSGRHFSVPVEIGAAYIGDPKVAVTWPNRVLHLRGHALLQRRGHELHDSVQPRRPGTEAQ